MWLFWYFDNALFFISVFYSFPATATFKGTFMQIEKLLINDRLCFKCNLKIAYSNYL